MKEKIAEWLNVVFGMRKFIAWFFLFTIGVIFRLKDYVNGEQFVDLMKSTFAGFVAGNTVEHLVSFGKDYMNSKFPKQDDTPDGDKDVEVKVEG